MFRVDPFQCVSMKEKDLYLEFGIHASCLLCPKIVININLYKYRSSNHSLRCYYRYCLNFEILLGAGAGVGIF